MAQKNTISFVTVPPHSVANMSDTKRQLLKHLSAASSILDQAPQLDVPKNDESASVPTTRPPQKKQKSAPTSFRTDMTPTEFAMYMEKALRPADTFLYLIEPGESCSSYGKILTINMDLVKVFWVFVKPGGVVEEIFDFAVNADCRDMLKKLRKGKWVFIATPDLISDVVLECFAKHTKRPDLVRFM